MLDSEQIIILIVAIAIVLLAAVVITLRVRHGRLRHERLKARFGPEYDRLVAERGTAKALHSFPTRRSSDRKSVV